MKKTFSIMCTFIVISVCLYATPTLAWHDATHMAVVRAAGLENLAYLAVGADMAKEKAAGESANHYCNMPKGVEVTPEMVLAQVGDYNENGDADGHLYGAIIAAIDDYLLRSSGGKYGLYPLGYAAHYIGDLSMPLHNVAYDAFNKANHSANDGIVERTGPPGETTDAKVARLAEEIRKRMAKLPPIWINNDVRQFHRDLATRIAAIANRAAALGYTLQETQRTRMTEEEAYMQLAQSAQLLQAVYAAVTP
ncbi:hypothetical protein [Geobacter sp. SVR]|uniref:hypothetical protein n=1 Tax=Geobacter sp. SVR TaxID=2495594 RepID=UPI00143F033F|nr:hypothetical protein [Geobacter sp. SVR]BCS52801.1 hypothetical protein GSVR_11090 [Geobacter sp. SVR]GCF86667.1 hypothetical protein GSbR_32670 [Geobacter sp. SVR]